MPSLLPRHGFSSACHPKPATLYASMRATAQATATGRAMCSINIFHEPSGRIVSPGSDDSSADDLGGSTAAGLRCRLAAGIQPHLRCALPAPAAGDGLEDFRIGFNELGLLRRRELHHAPFVAACVPLLACPLLLFIERHEQRCEDAGLRVAVPHAEI